MADALVAALLPRELQALESMRAEFGTSEGHGMPLDDACYLRYLRARSYNVAKASAMLTATLQWRQESGVQKIVAEQMDIVARENATGKVYLRGTDKAGRVVMIMRPKNENTHMMDDQLKHVVYNMERARAILQRRSGGANKMCIIVDYDGYSLRNAPPIKTSRATLNILQDHYPETLGAAYMINPPFIFNAFWKIIYPFIDAVTRQKFTFVRGGLDKPAVRAPLEANFHMDQLESALGGENALPFDSARYLAGPLDKCFHETVQSDTAVKAAV